MRFDKPGSKAQDCWHSADVQFRDGAGSVSLSLLPIMGGSTSIVYIPDQIVFVLPDLQDRKSLTLCSRSCSRWGRELLAFFFAYRGGQCCSYVQPLQNYFSITRLTRPKIVDAQLTLIFKMGQGACCFFLCLWRVETLPLCIFPTKSRCYYPTYRTKNGWRSVDAHFQDGAGSVLLSVLHIKVVNAVVMYKHYKITCQFPD